MPIYEYRCEACGHEREFLQKISDPALTDCPKCEEPKLKKLISAAAFRLKGGGWYETDFKSGNKKNLAEKSDSSSSGTSDKSDSKSTAKSDSSAAKSSTKKSDNSAKKQ